MSAGTPRIPVSVVTSVGLHAAGLFVFMHMSQMAKKHDLRVISNVDLLIRVHKPVLPQPMPKTVTPPSTWNFLKMALPAVPKIEPRALDIKRLGVKKDLMKVAPKLQDKGKLAEMPKLEDMDLNRKRLDMAKIEQKYETHKTAAALAALPPLEEVGRRRVANLPAAIALEERRQEAVGLQRMEAISAATRHSAPDMATLQEAAGAPAPASRFAEKIASMLPAENARLDLGQQMRQAPIQKTFIAPPPERRKESAAMAEKKKGVEIEGPLADRRVVSYQVPKFPDWAQQQGILEAAVSIRFWVSREGDVLPNLRIERSSGYSRLDRLAMDSLQRWKFAPLLVDEKQWGVITFRFVLE